MPSVAAQRYPRIEHIVVSDGPDDELRAKLIGMPGIVFGALAEHDADANNYGNRARNRGLELLSGEYIAYLDDDNAFRTDHVRRLVSAIEAARVDFVYSRMLVNRNGSSYEVGHSPPLYGGIDSSLVLHRRDATSRFGAWIVPSLCQHCPDWELVGAWLSKGATWAFVSEVTVDYYVP